LDMEFLYTITIIKREPTMPWLADQDHQRHRERDHCAQKRRQKDLTMY